MCLWGFQGCFGFKGSSGVLKGFKAVSKCCARPQTPPMVFLRAARAFNMFLVGFEGPERVYKCEKGFLPSDSSLLNG